MGKKIPKLRTDTEWAAEENRPSFAQVMKLLSAAETMTLIDLEDERNGGYIPKKTEEAYKKIMPLFIHNVIKEYNFAYHNEWNMDEIHPFDATIWIDEETGEPA